MDEKTINDELENLNKMQSAINHRKMQLQTAKDKTAKPWNLGISCIVHAVVGGSIPPAPTQTIITYTRQPEASPYP